MQVSQDRTQGRPVSPPRRIGSQMRVRNVVADGVTFRDQLTRITGNALIGKDFHEAIVGGVGACDVWGHKGDRQQNPANRCQPFHIVRQPPNPDSINLRRTVARLNTVSRRGALPASRAVDSGRKRAGTGRSRRSRQSVGTSGSTGTAESASANVAALAGRTANAPVTPAAAGSATEAGASVASYTAAACVAPDESAVAATAAVASEAAEYGAGGAVPASSAEPTVAHENAPVAAGTTVTAKNFADAFELCGVVIDPTHSAHTAVAAVADQERRAAATAGVARGTDPVGGSACTAASS
jgi:hypothetical protein